MNRGARMSLQLFAPAALVAALAFAVGVVPGHVPGLVPADAGATALTDGSYARLAQCLQFGGLGTAATMLVHSLWRLWRWERGREPQCPCGGLLSRPRRSRHGRLRRCLGCRRPHPET